MQRSVVLLGCLMAVLGAQMVDSTFWPDNDFSDDSSQLLRSMAIYKRKLQLLGFYPIAVSYDDSRPDGYELSYDRRRAISDYDFEREYDENMFELIRRTGEFDQRRNPNRHQKRKHHFQHEKYRKRRPSVKKSSSYSSDAHDSGSQRMATTENTNSMSSDDYNRIMEESMRAVLLAAADKGNHEESSKTEIADKTAEDIVFQPNVLPGDNEGKRRFDYETIKYDVSDNLDTNAETALNESKLVTSAPESAIQSEHSINSPKTLPDLFTAMATSTNVVPLPNQSYESQASSSSYTDAADGNIAEPVITEPIKHVEDDDNSEIHLLDIEESDVEALDRFLEQNSPSHHDDVATSEEQRMEVVFPGSVPESPLLVDEHDVIESHAESKTNHEKNNEIDDNETAELNADPLYNNHFDEDRSRNLEDFNIEFEAFSEEHDTPDLEPKESNTQSVEAQDTNVDNADKKSTESNAPLDDNVDVVQSRQTTIDEGAKQIVPIDSDLIFPDIIKRYEEATARGPHSIIPIDSDLLFPSIDSVTTQKSMDNTEVPPMLFPDIKQRYEESTSNGPDMVIPIDSDLLFPSVENQITTFSPLDEPNLPPMIFPDIKMRYESTLRDPDMIIPVSSDLIFPNVMNKIENDKSTTTEHTEEVEMNFEASTDTVSKISEEENPSLAENSNIVTPTPTNPSLHTSRNFKDNVVEELPPPPHRRSDILIDYPDYEDPILPTVTPSDASVITISEMTELNQLKLIPLIPTVIEQLRMDHVSSEEKSILKQLFGAEFWQLILAEVESNTSLDEMNDTLSKIMEAQNRMEASESVGRSGTNRKKRSPTRRRVNMRRRERLLRDLELQRLLSRGTEIDVTIREGGAGRRRQHPLPRYGDIYY